MTDTTVTPDQTVDQQVTDDASTTTPPATPVATEKTYTKEETEAYIKNLKDEAKSYRTKNATVSKELEDLKSTYTAEIESLTKKLEEARAQIHDATVSGIKAKYNITDEDAATFFTTDDVEKIEAIAKRLSERTSSTTNLFGNVVPREGAGNNTALKDEVAQAATKLFNF